MAPRAHRTSNASPLERIALSVSLACRHSHYRSCRDESDGNWLSARMATDTVYMYTCVHEYAYTCIRAYMHTCIHEYRLYMYTCIQVYMYKVYTCTNSYMQTNIHVIHVYTYARIHVHAYTCIHVYFIRSHVGRQATADKI